MPDTLIDILVERLNGLMPRIAIVLGSGLGSLVDEVSDAIRVPYAELPGFPASGVSGHAGELVAGYLGGEPVMMLSGRVHYYEKGDPAAMRAVIEALAGLGVQSLILTNSAGSVRQDIPPGSVMQITDHINYSGMNPLIGEESDNRFVGMTTAYDPDLMLAMRNAAIRATVPLFGGVYMWFSGPSFETCGGNPHGAAAGCGCRRHVHRAGSHPRPLFRDARCRRIGYYQLRCRHDWR